MQRSGRTTRWSVLAAVVLAGGSVRADVWTVDDDGGPGVDFTDIQPAVSAAASGDEVHVAAGRYGGFIVDGKSLVLRGAGDQALVDGTIRIRNLGPDAPVSLESLHAAPSAWGRALIVNNNQSPVYVRSCALAGTDGAPTAIDPAERGGAQALRVKNTVAVLVEDSELLGGRGADEDHHGGPGGEGLWLEGASMHLLRSVVRGGHGGHNGDVQGWAYDGGSAACLLGATLFCDGAELRGGDGGQGPPCEFNWMCMCDWCGQGGNGGHGIHAAAGSHLEHSSCTFQPGLGGYAEQNHGVDGLWMLLESSTAEVWSGPLEPFCTGDGASPACPCGNAGPADGGCANSTGLGARLTADHDASRIVAFDDLVLHVSRARPNKVGLLLQGENAVAAPFVDGILCAGDPTRRIEFLDLDAAGSASTTLSIVDRGQVQPGDVRFYQFWFRDGGGPCGNGSNLTNAASVDWL